MFLLDPFVGLVLETLDICETFLKNHSWPVSYLISLTDVCQTCFLNYWWIIVCYSFPFLSTCFEMTGVLEVWEQKTAVKRHKWMEPFSFHVVPKLSKSTTKVVTQLSQSIPKIVSNWSQKFQKVVSTSCQSCYKGISKLLQICVKVLWNSRQSCVKFDSKVSQGFSFLKFVSKSCPSLCQSCLFTFKLFQVVPKCCPYSF